MSCLRDALLLLTVCCCLCVHAQTNTFTPVLTNFPPKEWRFDKETQAIIQAAYTQPQQVVAKPLRYTGVMTAVMIQRHWLFTWKEKKLKAYEVYSLFTVKRDDTQYTSLSQTFTVYSVPTEEVVLKWERSASTGEPSIESVLQPKDGGITGATYTPDKGVQPFQVPKLPYPYGNAFRGIAAAKLAVGDIGRCADYKVAEAIVVTLTEKVIATNPAPSLQAPWVARLECQEGENRPFVIDLDADSDMICMRAGRIELRLCSLDVAVKDIKTTAK